MKSMFSRRLPIRAFGAACALVTVLSLAAGRDASASEAAVQAAAMPAAKSASWTLVWSDEFDGPKGGAPNPLHWGYDLGNQEANGWGNRELQYYTASRRNSFLDGKGQLVIKALRETGAGPCWNGRACDYSSARLLSSGKVNFRYGKVEARIKVPAGQGLWAAFWSLGQDALPWPDVGEIDMMEVVGSKPMTAYGTVHGPGYSGAQGVGKPLDLPTPLADNFHVFTIIKRPNEIIWLLDGQPYHRLTPELLPRGTSWVFERDFFLILNLAVGGDWPGSPDATTAFPAQMLVDWVRIYKEE
ncbi:MAG: glycoside hydrolase family 16 protein [Limnohabitans sp.]